MRNYYVYIMASPSRTLYVGVTNNLERRLWEHETKCAPGFTKSYNITLLIHIESYADIRDAIAREKEIKKWRRSKKLTLIEAENPEWRDLSHEWFS